MGRPRTLEAASLAIVGLALLAGAIWTRGRGVDELIDFGRELYVAWRISEGERLYVDLGYEYGPLSPHLNGLVFWIFGPGIRVLEAFNLFVLGLTTAAWHRLLFLLGGPLCAFVGSLCFLALFAFGHFDPGPVFHYLAPYSHAPVHGLALAVGTLLAIHRHLERGTQGSAALLGACAALAFLTKPEVALAVSAAVAIGLAGGLSRRGRAARAEIGAAGLGAAGVIGVVSLALATRMPWARLPEAIFGAWRPLLDPVHMGTHFASFSSRVLGLDDPLGSVAISLLACLVWALILGPAWILARRVPDTGISRWLGGGVAAALIAGLGIQATADWEALQWAPWGAPALAFCLVVALRTGLSLVRRGTGAAPTDAVVVLALCVMALGFFSRTGLRPRLVDYGFVAAMPAFGITVLALLHWMPRHLANGGHAGGLFRGAALGFLCFLVVGHLGLSQRNLETRIHPVGGGSDRLLAAERGPILADALAWIEREVPAGAPLLVVPEGVMLNYLSRRPSPTRHLSFIPPLVAWFGEDEILRDLASQRPTHVLVVDRETGEFGPLRFGQDYATGLGSRLSEGRRVVGGAGAEPLTGQGFGVRLLAPVGPDAAPGD